MSTLITHTSETLDATMNELETALLTPVVAGELQNWVDNVQEAAATFGTDWMRYLRTDLHPQYKEIAQTDNDLLTQVGQLMQVDRELFESLGQFQERLAAMARVAEVAGQEENRVEERRQAIEMVGISLILRIKKQQAAVATWLTESLYRDRGVGD